MPARRMAEIGDFGFVEFLVDDTPGWSASDPVWGRTRTNYVIRCRQPAATGDISS